MPVRGAGCGVRGAGCGVRGVQCGRAGVVSGEEGSGWYSGECLHIAGEVGLVGVPASRRDLREGKASACSVQREIQPEYPIQHLRPIPKRVQASPIQLPLAQPDAAGQSRYRDTAPDATQYLTHQPIRRRIEQPTGDLLQRQRRVRRPPDPIRQPAGPAGRPEISQRHLQIENLPRRHPQKPRRGPRRKPDPRKPRPHLGTPHKRPAIRPGDDQFTLDPQQIHTPIRQNPISPTIRSTSP